ncbi:MAG: PTS-dependent dihydroxyacetone kinase operon transcriptional regulator DhaR [Ardenticatenaceae bacterium]|nr:PTS-dependent dihydroxyacetone kinase operon transcriptional regulator DhaR [Anaerolineales bacterium]MCB9008760.1 PTS-dependent dihydroxyacetone kinase operon transcriptional regulator DhaR [Ardenticatenaceae bacterium]
MQPIGYPVNHSLLRHYWQTFMAKGQLTAVGEAGPDITIIQSWQRCAPLADPTKEPHPPVLREPALQTLLKSQQELITVAIPFMEDMHQYIEGSGSAILLADGTGCVLSLSGDPVAQEIVQARNLAVGSYWSEPYLGTNALGVTLVAAMPVQVVGAEHYFETFHKFTSTAAPIHDVNGRIIGIIGVVSDAESSTSHTLSLVMAVARAIGNQLQAELYLEEANRRLTELNTIMESITEGVITWSSVGRINHINAQAGRLLNLSPASILGLPLAEILHLPEVLQTALADKQDVEDTEVTLGNKLFGDYLQTVVTLRVVWEYGRPVGYMMMLRPLEQVRRLVHQQVGNQAMLKLEDIFAESAAMRPVTRQARIAARGSAPVMLRGEGGVGKNHLARAIHNDSVRAEKPFISINCHAIPRELIVSEFLGYEKESGRDGRPSKFELAHEGTLLLDQVESLSLEMQSALLQLIETGHVMRLGSSRPIPVDVRVVGATTADLETAVAQGNFLSHLYYRFSVFHITIPPLRERTEDILLLAKRLLARSARRHGQHLVLDDETAAILCRYPWPGNVRELEMVLERAAYQSSDYVIRPIDLPESVRNGRVVVGRGPEPQPVLSAAEAEREAIIRAGWACKGRVTEMARELEIGRTTLWRKMKLHQIDPARFRNGR